jgi:predicted RNase H-like HicB family nuclease
MKVITATIERTDTGYSAFVPEFDFCGTVGETIDEIRNNLLEAISLYFEDSPEKLKEIGIGSEEPVKFDFRMDVTDFFQLHHQINQSFIAKKAGINPSLIRQYARGIKHPGIKQARKIEKAIHQLGRELLQVRF